MIQGDPVTTRDPSLLSCHPVFASLQLEDPAIRWQMALYKDLPNRTEETSDPERTVERVLDIANVLFHLEQVRFLSNCLRHMKYFKCIFSFNCGA